MSENNVSRAGTRTPRVLVIAIGLMLALQSSACSASGKSHIPRSPPANQITLQFGDSERWAVVHVPPGYNPHRPAPVVLVFHGGGGFPDAVRFQSQMDTVSDREGFLAVYPAGTGIARDALLTFNAGNCCGYALKHNADDVGFTSALIDSLAERFSIDRNRVFATGISNGAGLSYRLACELSDRIAAIAPVATTMNGPSCDPKRPVSIMHFHGLEDKNALFEGGVGPKSISRANMRPVSDTIEFWVRQNGCSATPMEKHQMGAAKQIAYGSCREGAEVILWELADGGHTWPGGHISRAEDWYGLGKVNQDISASDLMWEFFKKHPLKRTGHP